MEKYDVELLPAADEDLDEIFDYILSDNPQTAVKMLDNIIDSLWRLKEFPHSGTPLTSCSLENFNFKMVIINPYIAFYRVIENKVLVYRVLHCARNYAHLLKESVK